MTVKKLMELESSPVTFTEPEQLQTAVEIARPHLDGHDPDDVTGVVLDVHEGDIEAIWVTEAARPYVLDAPYDRIR